MPRSKKNLVLTIVLIILIAIAYFYSFDNGESENEKNNFLSEIDFGEVDKMEVTRGTSSTVLLREGDAWKVDGTKDFYVRESLASDLSEYLDRLTEADFELISENSEKQEIYHSNEENGSRVKWYEDGERVAEFVIGRLDSATMYHTYIGKPGSDKTYLAKDVDLTGLFLEEDWRSKVVFLNDKENIDKVRFQYPDKEFTSEKKYIDDGTFKWEGVEPNFFEVNNEEIDKVLNVMSKLIAIKIPEQNFEGTGLDKYSIIVEVSGDGFDNVVMIGNKDGKEGNDELYYAKRADSDNIYLINKNDRDALEVSIEELK
jgi:hypothetical protein